MMLLAAAAGRTNCDLGWLRSASAEGSMSASPLVMAAKHQRPAQKEAGEACMPCNCRQVHSDAPDSTAVRDAGPG